MSRSFSSIIIIMVLLSCNSIEKEGNIIVLPNFSEREDLILIRDGLYIDNLENLYFKVLDQSIPENCIYRYINYLRVDALIGGNMIYTTPEISTVVDKKTFHKVFKHFSDSSLNSVHYQDKNHKYFLVEVASGGILHME